MNWRWNMAVGVSRCLLPLSLMIMVACSDDTSPASNTGDTAVAPEDVGADVADTRMAEDASDARGEDSSAQDSAEGTTDTADEADTDEADTDPTPDDTGDPEDTGVEPIDVPVVSHCENLNPRMCLLPWPSQRWLESDPTSATGFSMAFEPDAMPLPITGMPFDVTPYERFDGYSPSMQIITVFDEPVDLDGLAGVDTIERSLMPTHPTQLIDMDTGERVAHWVEIDARAESPEETLFYLRPATRLQANRSYAVALRDLRGISGAALTADAVFAALRDGTPTTSEQIEARRPRHEAIFTVLEEVGIARDTLVLAWSFHTASDASSRSRMITLRDDALEQMGAEGLGCTITDLEDNYRDTGARGIRGTFTVPWYLNAPLPPATFVLDEEGNPAYQGTEEIAFTAIIPRSLLEGAEPGRLVTFGHGLFGSAAQTLNGTGVISVAETLNAVLVATDWHGMSSKDLEFLAGALANVSTFYMLGENLQQGMVNQIALTRTMLGTCRGLPELANTQGEPTIDPEQSFFIGVSQGSILGSTFLTLSPDIDRGLLLVGGSTFSFMIERSTHFGRFELLLTPFYGSRLATGTLMVLSQMVWDDAETASWIGLTAEGSPDTNPKSFIYLVAENDAQVPNLSSDMAARTAGIPVLSGSSRTPWGIPVEEAPFTGSAYVAFGTWDPDPVGTNVSPTSDEGGHNEVGVSAPALEMVQHFFETGEIIVPCAPDCSAVGP